MLWPDCTRRAARKAGVPPLLASHAPNNTDAEEISNDGLPQGLLLGPRATTTLANTERAVTRRVAGDGSGLVSGCRWTVWSGVRE
jgi:hypothetical protein